MDPLIQRSWCWQEHFGRRQGGVVVVVQEPVRIVRHLLEPRIGQSESG